MHRIALAALLLTACSDGVQPRAAPTPAVPPPPASTTAAPRPRASSLPARPSPTGVHVVEHAAPVRGDVDGDGRADVAAIVESGPRTDDLRWRFGVRLAMTSAGTRIAWAEQGLGGMDAQLLEGIADVNGDGRGEVVVKGGTTVMAGYYFLVTFTRGSPRFVPGQWLVSGYQDGHHNSWGCRDGLLYTTATRRASGTITWLRLTGTRIVKVRTETRRWRAGSEPPAPFGEHRIGCGTVT